MQQTILQWSLGAIALVFAAAIQFIRPSGSRDDLFPFAGMFGFVIPGGAFAATLAWLGEALGMERTASYLRARERCTWHNNPSGPLSDEFLISQPLAWENYIMVHAGDRGRGKSVVGYVGAIGAYYGVTLASLLLVTHAVFQHHFVAHSFGIKAVAIAYAFAGYLFYLSVGWIVSKRTLRLSREVAGRR
jgi:hypothetical protein